MKKLLFLIITAMLLIISVTFAKHVDSKCCEKFTPGSPGERDCYAREHGQGFMLASGENYCCSGPSNKWLVQRDARDAYSNAVDYGGSQGTLCVEKEQCDYPKNAVLYCSPNSPCGTPTEFPSRSYFSRFKSKLAVMFPGVTYYETDKMLCNAEWLPIAVPSSREEEWAVAEGSIVLNYQFENLRTKRKKVLCGLRPAARTESYYGMHSQDFLCKELDCMGGDTIKCTVYATANDFRSASPTATWGESTVIVHSLQERCNNGNQEPDESDVDCGGICVDRLVPASQKRCGPYQQCNNNNNYCQEGMSCDGGRCIYHSYIDYFRGVNDRYRVVVERRSGETWTEVFSAQGSKGLPDYGTGSKRLHPTAKEFDNGASSLQEKLTAFPLRDGGLYRISVNPTNIQQPHAHIGYSFFRVCGDETCNGADDNCNGVIDDGLATCGCKDGASPQQETCNGRDDNCNEHIDDGFSGVPETCNGQDDNCDGTVDNIPADQIPLNSKQQGPCAGKKQVCSATGFVDDYSGVAGYEATETLCDNVDNDCDGTKDNNDGVGRCQCGDTAAPISGEICNNVDDDCDGQVDEQLATCGCKDGASPQTETCNNKDDDCDGTVNEENVCGGLPAADASWLFRDDITESVWGIPMQNIGGVSFATVGGIQALRIPPSPNVYNQHYVLTNYQTSTQQQRDVLEMRDVMTIDGLFWIENWNTGNNWQTLFAEGAVSQESYGLYVKSDGVLQFVLNLGPEYFTSTRYYFNTPLGTIVPKKWYYFAVSYDKNVHAVKIVVNGEEKQWTGNADTAALSQPIKPNEDYPLSFGSRGGDNLGLDGALTNIQLYRRALTQTEKQARYVATHPNKCGFVVCVDTEQCDATTPAAPVCKKKNGESCLTPLEGAVSPECFSGYCVHGTCAQDAAICGDGYCDNEPTCSGDCPAGSPAEFESFSTDQEAALWDNLPRYTPNVGYSTEKKAKTMKGRSQSTYDATIQKRIHIPAGATQMRYKTWGTSGAGVFVTLDGEGVS